MTFLKELIEKKGISYRSMSAETGIDRRLLKKKIDNPALFTLDELSLVAKQIGITTKGLFSEIIRKVYEP